MARMMPPFNWKQRLDIGRAGYEASARPVDVADWEVDTRTAEGWIKIPSAETYQTLPGTLLERPDQPMHGDPFIDAKFGQIVFDAAAETWRSADTGLEV